MKATTGSSRWRIASPPSTRTACLWVEHPIYGQAVFAIDRVKALAPDHPDWATTAPYDAILSGDQKAMEAFTEQDWEQIIGATHAGMTVEEFQTRSPPSGRPRRRIRTSTGSTPSWPTSRCSKS